MLQRSLKVETSVNGNWHLFFVTDPGSTTGYKWIVATY